MLMKRSATVRPGRHGARFATLALAASAVTLIGAPVTASPIDDQRAEVERITDELEALEQASDIVAEDHVAANAALEEAKEQIAATEERIAAKTTETSALREELAKMAVQAYMGAGAGVNPLFTDLRGATDTLQRQQLNRVALNTGTATTDELDAALADLEDERDRLASQRDEAADRAEDLAAAKRVNDEKKAEYQQARQDAEARLGALIREEEERRARESFERLQREAAAAQAAAAEAAERAAEQSMTPAATAQNASAAPPAAAARPEAAAPGAQAPALRPAPAPAPSPPPAPAAPPTSSRAGIAVDAAMSQLGVPWVFAMAKPGVGFDCSGLTSWAWAQAGVSMPHQSRMQFESLPHVPIPDAQPGDLIFYYTPISHVGIYLGGGKLVHAPNSGSVVNVATVNWNKVVDVARPG